jgi:tRNA(Ile)-lysidine synthase
MVLIRGLLQFYLTDDGLMLNDFLKNIREHKIAKKGDRILAAVSGGIDSMVMADLLQKAGLLSGIAHCNFQLRGKESNLDEQLVRKFAEKTGVPFHSIRFATRVHARKKSISIEMAARELRYEWFRRIREEEGYSAVAVAHNMNDNIETLILNLVRGTGIAGLTGMKPDAGNIIRPLLFAARKSIEEYQEKNKIPFREDRTNADTIFIRNKIRHQVIPILREINPSVESTLNETAGRLDAIYDFISDETSKIRKSIFREEGNKTIVNIVRLAPYIHNKALLFELFRPYGVSGTLVKDLQSISKGRTGRQIFTGTSRILRNRGDIIISAQTENECQQYKAEGPADLKKCPQIASVRSVAAGKSMVIDTDPGSAYLDFHKICFPVTIRKWRDGDFFYPFGMNSRKKLSDFFTDVKLSRFDKEKVMILESGGQIAWIIGWRIDNRFRITKSTKKVLVLKADRS